MKKILLVGCLMISFLSIGQMKVVEEKPVVKVGKVGSFGAVFLEMTKQDNTYTITYDDLKYQQIKVFQAFSFKDIDNTFENFYSLILGKFDNPPADDVKIELGDSIVWLKYTKSMGVVSVQFISSNKDGSGMGISSYMTKKQLNKLFGKT